MYLVMGLYPDMCCVPPRCYLSWGFILTCVVSLQGASCHGALSWHVLCPSKVLLVMGLYPDMCCVPPRCYLSWGFILTCVVSLQGASCHGALSWNVLCPSKVLLVMGLYLDMCCVPPRCFLSWGFILTYVEIWWKNDSAIENSDYELRMNAIECKYNYQKKFFVNVVYVAWCLFPWGFILKAESDPDKLMMKSKAHYHL